MNKPKISILVPVYNVEKYLTECIDSITNQTYKNIEIILVDDGSTDNSGAMCDEYTKKDSRIKVIHQKNQGLATVRNVSVAAATGDYIGFVDSDDFISPNMYSDMILIAQEKKADIVMCNLGYVNEAGTEIPNYHSAKPISKKELTGTEFVRELCNDYNSIYVVTVNKIYRRSLFEEICYPNGKINEDEAVIHRIAHKCTKIVFTSKIHYFYRQQPTSIMNKTFSAKRLDEIDALLDRVSFLKKHNYDNDSIINCEMYLIHICTSLFKKLDLKQHEHKSALKKYHKAIKPICKELLKSSIPTKNERIMLFFVKANPFLYLKIFNQKRK
ncbi:MAG: glycosyltransferase [Ruminococcaceae bacterium]|nr:glycosyltransferase [Oscillospiraceae bacterium]